MHLNQIFHSINNLDLCIYVFAFIIDNNLNSPMYCYTNTV